MLRYFKNFGDSKFYPLFDDKKNNFVNYEINVHDFGYFFNHYNYDIFSGSNNIINPGLFPGLVSEIWFRLHDVQDNADDFDVPVFLIIEVYENGK